MWYDREKFFVMDKKNMAPLKKSLKIILTIFALLIVGALSLSLINVLKDRPFNYHLFIPAGIALFAGIIDAIVGKIPVNHHHSKGKNKIKKIEVPQPEYRGGETFEAELDEPAIA
jgi:hypothetical protein